jgi:predicted PurR-regulated permease PerM
MAPSVRIQPAYPGADDPRSSATLATILVSVIVVATLYMAREVLVPVALAILLSFVLSPPVRFLQRWRTPRSLAVIAVVLVAFAAIFALGSFMVAQVNQLAADLPTYQTTLREKINSVRNVAGGTGTLERASNILRELGKEIDKPDTAPAVDKALDADRNVGRPIPVEVRQPDPGAFRTLVSLISPLIQPLTATGIVIIFVIFILLQRVDLRNRFIRLAGSRDLQRTTTALDDAGERLSRLLLSQLALNAAFGIVIGVGLWIIGIPSAPLWGILAAVLRFVPYVGAVISAVFPLILAAAVGPGWSMVLWTALFFIIAETVSGHVIEPLLYGRSTGLSPVAVVASATFWTWLWGPIGLVLATPLTVCLVVIGTHVERLRFLDVLLGNQPPLSPPELFYQRLLAGDPVEAIEQAQGYLKTHSLLDYHQDIAIAGLRLAADDSHRGQLSDGQELRVRETVADILDDLQAHKQDVASAEEISSEAAPGLSLIANGDDGDRTEQSRQAGNSWREHNNVLCVPGGGLVDEAAALIVSQLLRQRGYEVHAETADALAVSRIFTLDTNGAAIVCVCYAGEVSTARLGYVIRRLRRKVAGAFVLVCLLGDTRTTDELVAVRDGSNADAVETTLGDTIGRVDHLAGSTAAAPAAKVTPAAKTAA